MTHKRGEPGEVPVDVELIRAALPETWTHVHNVNWLRVGFQAKLAGFNWRSLPQMMAVIEKAGLVQRDGYCIRRCQPQDDAPAK